MKAQVVVFVVLSVLVLSDAQNADQCQLRAFPNEKRFVYSDYVPPAIDETFLLNLISVG